MSSFIEKSTLLREQFGHKNHEYKLHWTFDVLFLITAGYREVFYKYSTANYLQRISINKKKLKSLKVGSKNAINQELS